MKQRMNILVDGVKQKLLHSKSSSLWVLLFFMLLSFSMRFFSYTRSVIDWDESTYILMAEAMLQGKTLYKDIWDTKPPGIFLLFSGVQYFFDNAIPAIRILGTLFVGGTAFLLFKIGQIIHPQNKLVPLFTGIFYVSLISFNSFSFAISRGLGLEANTELFFIFFTVLGFYCYFKSVDRIRYFFFSGLFLGLAFIIKYFVVFDMLAIGFILLLDVYRQKKNEASLFSMISKAIYRLTPLLIGVFLPFLSTIYYFYATGDLANFWEVSFEVGSRYSSERSLSSIIKFFGDFIFLSGIISLCFVLVVVTIKRETVHIAVVYGLIWMFFSFVGACFSGKFFFHYLYPIFPAFSLVAANLYDQSILKNAIIQTKIRKGVAIFIFVSIPIVGGLKMATLFSRPDYPKEIAAYLGEDKGKLFVHNYYHIVHYYKKDLPLTPYYHPSLLYKPDHLKALAVDPLEEHKKIFNQKPKYVLYEKAAYPIVFTYLQKEYQLEKKFGEEIFLFSRKTE